MAQSNLAISYYYGEGIAKDVKQAVKWWKLSANQGYHAAQVSLGNCYFDGEGVEQNFPSVKHIMIHVNPEEE